MFTGIVEEIGLVESISKGVSSAVVQIKASVILSDLKIGDSVAVNGVCLTASKVTATGFCADVMHETLNRSSLGSLKKGSGVNLERAMPANGRFGGHIVSGHIDGVGTVAGITRDDNAIWYTINAGESILRYIVEKGSVAIDGISLTVAKVDSKSFSISAIPHTVKATILSDKKLGDTVNLENDIIGKYVEKLAGNQPSSTSKITRKFLLENGF